MFLLVFSKNQYANVRTDRLSLSVNDKFYETSRFYDDQNREVYFSGWNVSGSVKLKSMDFLPFKNIDDARKSFKLMRDETGANAVRFTVAWEGIHPDVDVIDQEYLQKMLEFMKAAIDQKIYILFDYHQDLYSRHIFNKHSKYTGNGAPEWITPSMNKKLNICFLCVHWSQNSLSNFGLRKAVRKFWDNAPIETHKGIRYVQDEYHWQLKKVLAFVKNNLSPDEFKYILGLDPMNEPVDGGLRNMGPYEWSKHYQWPYYVKVKQAMKETGWDNKILFFEPLVYWNSNLSFIRTGRGYYPTQNSQGFSFNTHFYDFKRTGRIAFKKLNSNTYLNDFDKIRSESNFHHAPAFLSEYGWPLEGFGRSDTHKIIKSMKEGIMLSASNMKSGQHNFYSPYVSHTQWQWDIYHNQHHEYQNDNLNRLMTKADAWNGENYSVITKFGEEFTIAKNLVNRAYPRRVAGDLIHFYYQDRVKDKKKNELNWTKLNAGNVDIKDDSHYVVMTWKNPKNNKSSNEIFLPKVFRSPESTIITKDKIINVQSSSREAIKSSGFSLTDDNGLESGLKLNFKSSGSLEFLFIINEGLNKMDASKIQKELTKSILINKIHPIIQN
tara:strand:- start:2434 stop:4257 length:1824 start_codon:yes stop_codon:yes gene_type:complete